jgi:hypothetical protein
MPVVACGALSVLLAGRAVRCYLRAAMGPRRIAAAGRAPALSARIICRVLAAVLLGSWAAMAASTIDETTRTEGTLPTDLRGVWLAVPVVEFPNGKHSLARIYEIGGEPAAPRLHLVVKDLPGRLGETLQAAQAAQRMWEPSAADLRELALRWDEFSLPAGEFLSIQYRVVGRDAYDDALNTDQASAGSLFTILATERYVPKPNHASQSIFSYGAREIGPDLIGGTHVQGTVAAAPFPIPLSFNGTFRMYRIAPAERGWRWRAWRLVARLTDGLRGCARRTPG